MPPISKNDPKDPIPAEVKKGNNKLKPTVTPSPTPTLPTTKTSKDVLKDLPKGAQSDYKVFDDGTYVLNSGGSTGGVATEPYVSTVPPTQANPNPKAIVVLPTADGKGFEVKDIDAAVQEYLSNVPRAQIEYYKQQLQAYYPSAKDYKVSLAAGPMTDKDLGFQAAIKKSLIATSVDNFNTGKEIAKQLALDPTFTQLPKLYSFQGFVDSRNPLPLPSSMSDRSSGLTTEMDANAEFNRTVQQYIGNPALVDKIDALRKEYWNKLHQTEINRSSTSSSTTDVFGNTTRNTVAYAPMSEQDRLDLRLGLVINGGTQSKSVGIVKATQSQLQDAGGLVGDTYTKIVKNAADYGMKYTHEGLLSKVNESLKPGGSVEEQNKSVVQASKLHYSTLAPAIDQGLKVSDIASQYQRLKEDELERPLNSIDIYDSNVQNALRGDKLQNINDFTLGVRSLSDWRYTKKANEAAAGLVDTIARMWGRIG